jgi:hypothetical protein
MTKRTRKTEGFLYDPPHRFSVFVFVADLTFFQFTFGIGYDRLKVSDILVFTKETKRMDSIKQTYDFPAQVLKGQPFGDSESGIGRNGELQIVSDYTIIGGSQEAGSTSSMSLQSISYGEDKHSFAVGLIDQDNVKNMKVKLEKSQDNKVTAIIENPNDQGDPNSSSIVSVEMGTVSPGIDEKYFNNEGFFADAVKGEPIEGVNVVKNDREKASSLLLNGTAFMLTVQNGVIQAAENPFQF